MEVEYHEDRTARRRHIRGMILFISAAVLYLAAVLLVLTLLAALLGREAARWYAGGVFLVGFAALPLTWLYGVSHSILYCCPRCGRRLPRAVPQHQPEPNSCYICTHCRIAWDLGWHLGENA